MQEVNSIRKKQQSIDKYVNIAVQNLNNEKGQNENNDTPLFLENYIEKRR